MSTPFVSVESEIERAKQSALASLGAASEAPRFQLPQEIATDQPARSEMVRRQPAQLEKRSHQMSFRAAVPPSQAEPSAPETVNEPEANPNLRRTK